MAFFKKKNKESSTNVSLRDNTPVTYTKEKEKSKNGKEKKTIKTEYDDGQGTHGMMKTQLKKTNKDNMSKNEAGNLNATTETKINGNEVAQMKSVQSSYSYSATLTGTPEEIEKQKKKIKKDMEKKRKEIEKQRKKLLK